MLADAITAIPLLYSVRKPFAFYESNYMLWFGCNIWRKWKWAEGSSFQTGKTESWYWYDETSTQSAKEAKYTQTLKHVLLIYSTYFGFRHQIEWYLDVHLVQNTKCFKLQSF